MKATIVALRYRTREILEALTPGTSARSARRWSSCGAPVVMYETDILIRIQRGHARAELKLVKDFVFTFDFAVLPLSENIGHRALVYIEEYTLSAGLRSADALIAATAVEQNLELVTSNARHFRAIRDLQLKPFRP